MLFIYIKCINSEKVNIMNFVYLGEVDIKEGETMYVLDLISLYLMI